MGDGLELGEVVGVGEVVGDSLIIVGDVVGEVVGDSLIIVGDVVGEVEATGLWVVIVSGVEDLPLVAAKATTLMPEIPAIVINPRLDKRNENLDRSDSSFFGCSICTTDFLFLSDSFCFLISCVAFSFDTATKPLRIDCL
jgi:hypothetical protein